MIATINRGAALAPLVVGGLLVVSLMHRLRPTPEKRAELAAALARAEATWHSLVEDWRTKTVGVDFTTERQVILGLKAQLDALSVERAARLQALAKPVSEVEQRLTCLEQFRIEDAGLFNIGAARIAVLRSWGVETAAEINEDKVGSIPGFGRSLTERLVNWRESLEQRFHFEPTAVTDPRDVQRIDRELAARRARYMRELRRAIVGLEKRINDIGEERRALWQLLEAAFNERMLAWHDAESAAGH
jgi:DNA-binding helix-hairpin-helix protein with protein kinase domain